MHAHAARRARRERPPPARARAGQRVRRSGRHGVKAIGQQPRAEFASLLEAARSRRPAARRARPKFFAAGDAINGGARVVEAVREAKLAARRRRSMRRVRDGDPLARARRPGREDGVAAPRGRAAARRQERPGVSRVRARAPRRADARVHARSTTGRSAVTTRSSSRTSSSSSSRRSCTGPTSPRGWRTGSPRQHRGAIAGARVRAGRPARPAERQPRDARRGRRGARRAAARDLVAAASRCSARRPTRHGCGRPRGGPARRRGGYMADLKPWYELRRRHRRPRRGRAADHRRLAHRAQARGRPRRLRQLPALLALLPRLGDRARRHGVRRLRPRPLQGLRDLRRGLPHRRDRDGGGARLTWPARSC